MSAAKLQRITRERDEALAKATRLYGDGAVVQHLIEQTAAGHRTVTCVVASASRDVVGGGATWAAAFRDARKKGG